MAVQRVISYIVMAAVALIFVSIAAAFTANVDRKSGTTYTIERAKEMKGMGKNQKSYTLEFKQQILDLYHAGGTSYPQLEREYGVNRSTISGWVKQLSPIKVSDEETVTLKEYKALQKEIQRLKTENEILKKATAIFAKEQ